MALENFTTYTKVDGNGRYTTVTANDITATALTRNEDAYIYADKGADHFGASWTHSFETIETASTAYGSGVPWAVSNSIDDAQNWITDSDQAIRLRWYDNNGSHELRIQDCEDAEQDTASVSQSTRYYPLSKRTSETAISCEIYSDASHTTLVDTIAITITSGRRYRYIFPANSLNTGDAAWTLSFEVDDLDLNEAAGVTVPVMFMHYAKMRA